MSKELLFRNTLRKYLPEIFVEYVTGLLVNSGVSFKIVKPRNTKLGDFKASGRNLKRPQITVNGDLNPYSFLITTLHEIAHFHTYQRHGQNASPHGTEWKSEFRILLKPVLEHDSLPKSLQDTLSRSINNLKASSCTDIHLSRELKKYDGSKNTVSLEELNENCLFILNKKTYSKGKLRRTRYLCKEISTGKSYLIHALAEVNEVNND